MPELKPYLVWVEMMLARCEHLLDPVAKVGLLFGGIINELTKEKNVSDFDFEKKNEYVLDPLESDNEQLESKTTSQTESSPPLRLSEVNETEENLEQAEDANQTASTQAVALAREGQKIDLPYKEELETFYKKNLDNLQVVVSPKATAQVGAIAFAVSNFIVLSSPDLSREIIAEEVGHAIQQGGDQDKPSIPKKLRTTSPSDQQEEQGRQVGFAFGKSGQGGQKTEDSNPTPNLTRSPVILARAIDFHSKLEWMNPNKNSRLRRPNLSRMLRAVNTVLGANSVQIDYRKPSKGVASWAPTTQVIKIKPFDESRRGFDWDLIEKGDDPAANDRIISLTHELQHAHDAYQRTDKGLKLAARMSPKAKGGQLIRAEWRAHAQQTKTTKETLLSEGEKGLASSGGTRHRDMLRAWTKDTFKRSSVNIIQSMFANTKSYLRVYLPQHAPWTDQKVAKVIAGPTMQSYVKEAFDIFPAQ